MGLHFHIENFFSPDSSLDLHFRQPGRALETYMPHDRFLGVHSCAPRVAFGQEIELFMFLRALPYLYLQSSNCFC